MTSTSSNGTLRVFPPDRRGDQPGQLGRPAGRPRRPGDRDQLGDRHRRPAPTPGVGFAIPIDMAANLADRLIKDGKVTRAMIGIELQPLTPALASSSGSTRRPRACWSADRAREPRRQGGPEAGRRDHRLRRHARPRASRRSATRGLQRADRQGIHPDLLREGQEKTAKVTLVRPRGLAQAEERLDPIPRATSPRRRRAKAELSDFGLDVQELTPELAKQFGPPSAKGLVISDVKDGSPAEANGLEAGMLDHQGRQGQEGPGLVAQAVPGSGRQGRRADHLRPDPGWRPVRHPRQGREELSGGVPPPTAKPRARPTTAGPRRL